MATFGLPPPQELRIHEANAAENWRRFEAAWRNYSLATSLTDKTEGVQIATLLTVIGEESRDVYSTFQWTNEEDAQQIENVIARFREYCMPVQNVPFERYVFQQVSTRTWGDLRTIPDNFTQDGEQMRVQCHNARRNPTRPVDIWHPGPEGSRTVAT